MHDHQLRAFINELRDTATQSKNNQNLREKLSGVVMMALKGRVLLDKDFLEQIALSLSDMTEQARQNHAYISESLNHPRNKQMIEGMKSEIDTAELVLRNIYAIKKGSNPNA